MSSHFKKNFLLIYMKNRLSVSFLLFFFSFSIAIVAQEKKKVVDSLLIEVTKTNNLVKKINLYFELSNNYEAYNIEKSIAYSRKILELAKQTNNLRGIGLYYSSKAHINNKLGDYNKAFEATNKADLILFKCKDTLSNLKNACIKARVLGEIKTEKEFLTFTLNCFEIAKKTKYYNEIGELSYLLADNYSTKNIKKALELLVVSTKNYRQAKNEIGLAGSYYLMSKIYFNSKQYDFSLQYIKKCLELVKKFPDQVVYQDYCFRQFAAVFIEKKDYNNALKFINKAIHINKTFSYGVGISYLYNKKAEIYIALNNIKVAQKYLKLSLASKPHVEAEFLANKYLGICSFNLKKYKEASEYHNKAIALLGKDNEIDNRDIFRESANTLGQLGNYKKAFAYQKKFSDLNNQFLINEKLNRINELQTQFDVNEKDLKIKMVTIENQKKIIQTVQQKKYLEFLSLILLVAIVLLFIIIYFFVKNKRKNKIIAETNFELETSKVVITKSLFEKEVLLKEIHHRVKNNLQLVISLLNIQARNSEAISIQEFLEKGRSRISAIALIHQNLYQSESIDKVIFQEYLDNLIQNMQDSFCGDNSKITFSVDAKKNSLGIQTSIPLGLIINELITNAIKHAFPEDLKGRIEIELKQNIDKSYDLTLSDNGIGISIATKSKKSLGLELVHLLVSQLKGTVTVIQNSGTTYKINFHESLI